MLPWRQTVSVLAKIQMPWAKPRASIPARNGALGLKLLKRWSAALQTKRTSKSPAMDAVAVGKSTKSTLPPAVQPTRFQPWSRTTSRVGVKAGIWAAVVSARGRCDPMAVSRGVCSPPPASDAESLPAPTVAAAMMPTAIAIVRSAPPQVITQPAPSTPPRGTPQRDCRSTEAGRTVGFHATGVKAMGCCCARRFCQTSDHESCRTGCPSRSAWLRLRRFRDQRAPRVRRVARSITTCSSCGSTPGPLQ